MNARARAAAGIVGPVAFITSWVIAGALRDGYDPITQAISRLAESGAPNRWIVTAGMVTFGVSALVFASVMRSFTKAGAFFMVVAGISSFGVAAFPCTSGCPGIGSTFFDTAHVVVAGVHYVALTNAPLSIWWEKRNGPYARFCLAMAVATGIALTSQALGIGPNGLMQRIGITLSDTWMVATAVLLMRSGDGADL